MERRLSLAGRIHKRSLHQNCPLSLALRCMKFFLSRNKFFTDLPSWKRDIWTLRNEKQLDYTHKWFRKDESAFIGDSNWPGIEWIYFDHKFIARPYGRAKGYLCEDFEETTLLYNGTALYMNTWICVFHAWSLLPGYIPARRIAVDIIFIDSLFWWNCKVILVASMHMHIWTYKHLKMRQGLYSIYWIITGNEI